MARIMWCQFLHLCISLHAVLSPTVLITSLWTLEHCGGTRSYKKFCPNISKPFLHHDIIQPFILQYPFPPKSQSQDTKVSEVAPKKGMLVTYADMSRQAEPQKNSIDVWILCHILSPKRKNPTPSGKQMAQLSCISFLYFCILHSAFK